MKKVTLEVEYDQLKKIGLDYLGREDEDLVILDGLKISKEVCVNLWKVPNNAKIEKERLDITELSEINRTEKETTYLIKKRPTELTLLLEKHGIYYEFPLHINRRRAEVSIMGLSKDINLFFLALDKIGIRYRVIKATDYITPSDILSTLTKKQKEVLYLALKEGYFKTPRRTDAHTLAEKLGIRHTTFLQHLRRAQEKILKKLL